MTVKKRKSAEVRRHDIIEAAMEIIRHEGVARLTTRSLSKAVGIAQPTLFLHFGNKSHVLLALVDTIQERLQQEMAGLGLAQMTPLERLKVVIRAHLNFIQRQPGIPRLLFSEELQSGDPLFRDRMNELVSFFLNFIAGLISAAQAHGEIRPDIVPQQNACILIAAVQGLAFRWVLSDQRFELTEQADAVIVTLIEGWAPRPGS
ncbi:TetR/AcrR family transcriptional regulator [Thiobacillus denitrificans]|uniref:TetR/AcrR family transcriptional regulator n=1 Tax=Thiobacillus denitrificans TaxID=36861 RepID=UPI00036E7E6C|nr:TetR/AcrR family transcriptional regulator [Thiobacillus denitrificans]